MSRVDTPHALALVRTLDAVLSAADYRPDRVDLEADRTAGLVTAWQIADPLVRARTLLFLVQRSGDAVDTAVSVLSGLVAPAWTRWALAAARAPSALALLDAMVEADPHDTDPGPFLGAAVLLASLVHAPDTLVCGFCRIGQGQDPAVQIIDEQDDTVAFVPRDPTTGSPSDLVPGHWLVIPRVHVPDAVAVPDVTADVFGHAAALAREQGPDALQLLTSVGAAATQTVAHLHVHLVPREWGDGLRLPWDPHGLQGR